MTQLAFKAIRAMVQAKRPRVAGQIASATRFDLTEVVSLIDRTQTELTSRLSKVDPRQEHGGLLFGPSPLTWIEFEAEPGRRVGVLVEDFGDEIYYLGFGSRCGHIGTGRFEIQADREHFISVPEPLGKGFEDGEFVSSMGFGQFVAASLMLINAPRGVERHATPVHKGVARDMRRAGVGEIRPGHIIRLSTTPGSIGEGSSRGGSPKAFHFCRSHVRRLHSGVVTRVRAHWRGDPTVGVTDAEYAVAA